MKLSELLTEKKQARKMPERPLGKIGRKFSILSLGGQGSLETQGNEKNCVEIIRRAYELGIRYMDMAPIYGPSEDYYGKALRDIRKDVFLATKSDNRDRDGALKDIEKSLKRLKTDHIDLWQIHHIDEMEEINEVFGKNGAFKAFMEMKEQKVVKHIGFTGHQDPDLSLEMMKRYDGFETVLCPVNAADIHMDKPYINSVVKEANKKNMGVIGMKVFSQGYIFHPHGLTTAWEPLVYALSQAISTMIVGFDTVAQLEECVAIATAFSPLNSKQLRDIESKTKRFKRRGNFFRKEYGGYQSKDSLEKPYSMSHF